MAESIETPKIIDNVSCRLGDDIAAFLGEDACVYVASNGFSLSAFEHLADELESVKEIRFVFTAPAFVPQAAVKEKIRKERREFFIPGVGEASLLGTEYEIRLRNRLMQKAIAKRCGSWIRKGRVKFMSVAEFGQLQDMFIVETTAGNVVYVPFQGFTSDALGYERGTFAAAISLRTGGAATETYRTRFKEVWANGDLRDVTELLSEYVSNVYRDNEPKLVYFLVLKHLFEEALKDFDEDNMPNAAVGYEESAVWKKLFDFQHDAAIAIINKLEKYNGCILADSVGLGKTFTALAVIKYYELRNKNVLVLCPKKLEANWNVYNRPMYKNNPFAAEKLRYDVLCHTDIQRERGESNGLDLSRINWGGYDLVVIDESHNFRNDKGQYLDRETRYQALMRKVMREGVKTKVLMLSATPVNNRFNDLKNQLRLAYGGGEGEMNRTLGANGRTVETIFRDAENAFRNWSEDEEGPRTAEALFKALPSDFLELLDAVTIARSRKHIERFYNTDAIGKFPQHLSAQSEQCPISTDPNAVKIKELNDALIARKFCVYTPTQYILPSRRDYYDAMTATHTRRGGTIHQAGREFTLKNLMVINVLKRLESSVFSFRKTLASILLKNETLLHALETGGRIEVGDNPEAEGLDDEDEISALTVGKHEIDIRDLDVETYKRDLKEDIAAFKEILGKIEPIDPAHDAKLQRLREIICAKVEKAGADGNRKVLVFSAFADTAEYLYENLAPEFRKRHLGLGIVTGKNSPKCTVPDAYSDFQEVLSRFSPVSKECPEFDRDGKCIDILFGTDCISEGQNLQDCDTVVNYDIHWNPVRIIQRFGRVDRIGSRNESVQLVNFWPDIALNEYIDLTDRVKNRMTGVVIAGTGMDNPIAEGDDVSFRDEPLGRMKGGEIIDMESLKTGVSITDLGLNEYALALRKYMEQHPSMGNVPPGINAVVAAKPEEGLLPGVVFFLKNRDEKLRNPANYFHPFYAVYLTMDGKVIKDSTQGKAIVELLRKGCEGVSQPLGELCREFNRETKDGFKMERYSELLSAAISSIAEKKGESDIDSLFSSTETTALAGDCANLDAFELMAFFVIR